MDRPDDTDARAQEPLAPQNSSLEPLVARLGRALQARGLTLACAESCTGGLIMHELTNMPGSSAWLLGGVVAYADSAKTALLGVEAGTIEAYGAVSRQTVEAMAEGAAQALGGDTALAVSGIAGPGGGTAEKPVGTVWMAWTTPTATLSRLHRFTGSRAEIKLASARAAMEGLIEALEGDGPERARKDAQGGVQGTGG